MKLTRLDLRLPMEHGVRLVASSLLDEIGEAGDRMAAKSGKEDLHDFRVSIRRLRSWIRSFSAELQSLRNSDLKRLKKIGNATSEGRDIEVHLEWLGHAAGGISRSRKRGVAWLVTAISAARDESSIDLPRIVEEEVTPLRKSLSESLSEYTESISEHGEHPTLASAIAARLSLHYDELGAALDLISGPASESEIHCARIAAKRLRYLLEPAALRITTGKRVLQKLKSLQDSLGSIHDLHLLAAVVQGALFDFAMQKAQRDAAKIFGPITGDSTGQSRLSLKPSLRLSVDESIHPGDLLAVGRKITSDVTRHFNSVSSRWLGGKHAAFGVEIEGIRTRLMELN